MKVESLLGNGKIFPPGFRFHPTDEELVLYYLKKKLCCKPLRMDVIAEVDVYKWDPEDWPGMSKLNNGDRQWFFFSPRDRKYPNGGRSNRATKYGYWKATGKDRVISCGSRPVGLKKTLVFYRGRAPNGERTDWVMHEYTMDEEELKRCDYVQDYYALYKAFKKSGPGPKNGEQYGAPFREEDWVEDDLEKDSSVKQAIETTPITDTQIVGHETLSAVALDDLEQIINSLVADELVPEQPPSAVYGFALDHFLAEENSHSIGLPAIEPQNQPPTSLASFDRTRSTMTQSEIWEVPEEDFLEDFLEMDDLIGPVLGPQFSDKRVDDLVTHQLDEIDGYGDFALYHDASLFFDGMHKDETGHISHTHVDSFDNGAMKLQDLESAAVTHPFQPQFCFNNLISGQMWANEPSRSDLTSTEANHDLITASSSGRQNHDFVANENESSKQDDDGTTDSSWLSSSLWSFVESIPATPASASEIALVNKAFERMSSLSRVRSLNVAAVVNASSSSRKSRRYFICFSLIGLMSALFWMVVK